MLKIPADRYLAVIYTPIGRTLSMGRVGTIELVQPVQHPDSDNWILKPLFVLDVLKTESGYKTTWDSGNPPGSGRGDWLLSEAKRIVCKDDRNASAYVGFCIDGENNLRAFDPVYHESRWLFPLLDESDDCERADFERLVLEGAYLWPSDRRPVAAPPGPAPH